MAGCGAGLERFRQQPSRWLHGSRRRGLDALLAGLVQLHHPLPRTINSVPNVDIGDIDGGHSSSRGGLHNSSWGGRIVNGRVLVRERSELCTVSTGAKAGCARVTPKRLFVPQGGKARPPLPITLGASGHRWIKWPRAQQRTCGVRPGRIERAQLRLSKCSLRDPGRAHVAQSHLSVGGEAFWKACQPRKLRRCGRGVVIGGVRATSSNGRTRHLW